MMQEVDESKWQERMKETEKEWKTPKKQKTKTLEADAIRRLDWTLSECQMSVWAPVARKVTDGLQCPLEKRI